MTDQASPSSNDKSFSQHMRATLVLGIPLVGAQLAQMLINVTDTVMLGWLGTRELAAGTLAFQTFFIFLIFGLGFGAAMIPLIANALGRDDPRSVRRAARMGMWALLVLAVVFMVPLWFTGSILVALGQEQELADLAQLYMRIAQWSMIPAFFLIGVRAFLTSLEKAKGVLVITVLTAILNGVLNYAFIFGNLGAPALGMQGAGVATVIANFASAFAIYIYVIQEKDARNYEIFVRLWRPDWQALRDICRMGIPISLTILAEAGMFSAASLMIGWIGTVHLAAHGIAMQWASLTFMVPLGLANAASVRVGNAAGRQDKVAVGRAAIAVAILGLGFAAIAALVFWLLPEPLIALYISENNTDKQALIAIAVPLLLMAAAFQIFDTLQVCYGSSLRGLQDTAVPMVIGVISYWLMGMCSAYILAFTLGFGSVGVWGGLVIGLLVASVALTCRFMRREKLGLI